MIKVGDLVNYHDVIGEEITSRGHVVKAIVREPDSNFSCDVAWITGKSSCVAVAALSLMEGWDDRAFTDLGLTVEALDKIVAEDLSQRGIWGEQTHHADRWNTILTEEHGELAKAILEDDLVEMIAEGVQVATLALKIAWMAYKQLQEKKNGKK